jgi:hypothetical protein
VVVCVLVPVEKMPTRLFVAQEELDLISDLEAQAQTILKYRDERACSIIERLMQGQPVEPGPRVAEIQEKSRGPTRVFQLSIDGRVVAPVRLYALGDR